jgi:hypothetical protein
MTGTRTIDERAQQLLSANTDADAAATGFGAEFRELARQRRFVRSGASTTVPEWRTAATSGAASVPAPTPRDAPQATPAPAPAAAPTPTPAPTAAVPVATSRRAPAPAPASPPAPSPRMSTDQRATLLELARMSDRLVQARELLVVEASRADHLQAALDSANAGLQAADQRLMASRALVNDAQRTTRELAERCAWLEGRCEMLGEALEQAVNASFVTRWRWRREQRARLND